ncbi:MAG TPA: CARDB domain-containing protein, partial [Dongiaceae bacterium]|nr:CARDB domain-containing protein [Dongiaceae bacterium]
IPASVTPGSKFLIARADALDQIPEGDESNNVAVLPIEIGDFIDLQITALAAPATGRTGQPITASVTLRNAGSAPSGPFSITFYLAPANPPPAAGDGIAIGAKVIPALGALARLATTAVLTVPANLAGGSYVLSAVADADNVIPEVGGNDGDVANGRVAAKPITIVVSP